MKAYVLITAAALTIAGVSGALAQAGGDNPGGRGVTSTGGPKGVTGMTPDGKQVKPAATTGSSSGATSMGSASGNGGNSMNGANSPSGSSNAPGSKASSAGGGEK